jgi:2-polyprenyl-3-methyl-5-hydroxy-6-metoxy-1,4-benzoquinol methylase
MKSPKVSRRCPVCAASGRVKFIHRQHFVQSPLVDFYDVVACRICGMVFADRIPRQADLDRYYERLSKYAALHGGSGESEYDLRRYNRIASELNVVLEDKSGAILEVGCSTGGLLRALRDRGFKNVRGVDPSASCVAIARSLHKVNVSKAAIADLQQRRDKYAAIVLVGVLEHVRDIKASAAILMKLLRPGGIIYCAQPDAMSFYRSSNAPFQQFSVEHVNFFTAETLETFFRKLGFEAIFLHRWMVEWRQGITDSVVSGAFRLGGRGWSATQAVQTYVRDSKSRERRVLTKIARLAAGHKAVILWGAGSFCRHLLAVSDLAKLNIVAVVDADVRLQGEDLVGHKVLRPSDVHGFVQPILVVSRAFQAEIVNMIKQDLGLRNEILLL